MIKCDFFWSKITLSGIILAKNSLSKGKSGAVLWLHFIFKYRETKVHLPKTELNSERLQFILPKKRMNLTNKVKTNSARFSAKLRVFEFFHLDIKAVHINETDNSIALELRNRSSICCHSITWIFTTTTTTTANLFKSKRILWIISWLHYITKFRNGTCVYSL